MARKIPRDCPIADWSENTSVETGGAYSLIRDGFLNTELFLPIARDRKVCLALHRHFAEWKYANLFGSMTFIEALSSPAAEISDAIIFTSPTNHWHFFLDGLANLSEELLAQCDTVFVDQALSDDQMGFLATYAKTLGASDLTIERLPQATYAVRNVYVPVNAPFDIKARNLRAQLRKIDAPGSDTNKRIYVTRKRAKTRRLINEEELVSMLAAEFGFRCLQNEAFSLVDQLSLYRESEIVIGPHGAGLTNIVFSACPEFLIELFNTRQQSFYGRLSEALDIQYIGIEGAAATPTPDGNMWDDASFRVDVAQVRNTLRETLGD